MRYYSTHSAFGVWHITLVARDDVHVAMEYRLTCSLAYIDTDIVAIGMETLVNFLLNVLQHDIHRLTLVVCQIKIRCHMTLGNDKCMTWRNWITIVESYACRRFTNYFHIASKITEMATNSIFPRQLVEVVILIEFVAFIGNKALVWQFYIALVSVLLMNGMNTETLLCQITTHGKVGCTLWRKKIGNTHQHFCLCVWFKNVQYIVTNNCVEPAFWIVGTIIIVIAHDVMSLLLQFVSVETISATEVEDFSSQQSML